MKTRLIPFIAILLTVMILAGCAAPTVVVEPTAAANLVPTMEPTAAPLELTDGLGRIVTLAAIPQRIVSLAPSATEILFAVGAGEQVIGRDSFSNYPEEVANLADIGGSMGSYSYETITSLNPDLVIAAEINTPEQVKALEDLGLSVYYISNPTSLGELYLILETVGTLTGNMQSASELVVSLKARVETVMQKTSSLTTKPVVFYELDGSEPAKPWTAGPGTFIDILIELAGGINVGHVLSGAWAQISAEELLVQNPEIILLGDAAYGMTAEQVAARAGWENLRAVQEGKIYAFNDDLVSRPGPRLVDALEELSKLLHPEVYP